MATTETRADIAIQQPTRIVSLVAENVKRIEVVEITPKGDVITIGGKNSQGKTSLLDAIEMALRGGRYIPKDPVRHGAELARIVLDLGTIVVERTCNADREGKLVVRDKSGKSLSSPQTILDRLLGKISFDPLEFSNLKPREQVDRLKQIVGLDFTPLDQQREKLVDERKLLNARVKELDAQVAAIEDDPESPEEETPVVALVEKLQARQKINTGNEAVRKELRDAATAIDTARVEFNRVRGELLELERKLAIKRDEVAAAEAKGKELVERQAKLTALVETLQDEDVDEVQARIDSVELNNRRARDRQERARLTTKSEELALQADGRDELIAGIDTQKAKLLAEAEFPIPGLSFTDDGATYKGAIWPNMGERERIQVSMAMGLAMNPNLPIVMIRNGSLVDEDGLAIIAAMAAKHEPPAQVWVERVSRGQEVSVVIEAGRVKEDRGAVDFEPPL